MDRITYNPESEYRRISFKIGNSKEGHYQLGQPIASERAYIYSIDDTSTNIGEGKAKTFIRSFTIKLINKVGEVYAWYVYEKGTGDSVTLQLNNKFIEL